MATTVKMIEGCLKCLRMSNKNLKLLSTSASFLQIRHHTIIMERVYPVPPGEDGGLPDPKEMNELHKILRHVKVQTYPNEMQCILTDFVNGIGIRGDVVTVKRNLFHLRLFPAGLAVYASPENIQEFEEERKAKGIEKSDSRLGVFARMAMKDLTSMKLQIPMNEDVDWTLTKQHVKVAFRTQGVELEDSCITLPEDPVTTFQDLTVEVRLNNLESVKVKAKVVPAAEKFATAK